MINKSSLYNAIGKIDTQYSYELNPAKKLQLVIGLDFGTAFTKVVIAETRRAYAVKFFKDGAKRSPHLLPGIVSIDTNGLCSLGLSKNVKRVVSDLKMRLIQGDCNTEKKLEIIAFLALVFQFSRMWFMRTFMDTYKNYMLDWNVNVGLPTDNFHNEKLAGEYRRIVNAAWVVSVVVEHVTLDVVEKVLASEFKNIDSSSANHRNVETKLLHEEAISLFPEFIAQIVGYVRSPKRQDDLHMLIDVGAGTVDIAVFNVHQVEGEDVFPIFTKHVSPMGVHINTLHRLHKGRYVGQWKPNGCMSRPCDIEFANLLGCDLEQLREIDRRFKSRIVEVIFDQLRYTKANRYPLSRRWDDGIPVFLCGGGAFVELYGGIVNEIEKRGTPYKLRLREIPRPARLVCEDSDLTYHRLSVAYGLSFDAFDIGELKKMEDVEDATPTKDTSSIIFCKHCDGSGGLHGSGCRWCGGSGMMNDGI